MRIKSDNRDKVLGNFGGENHKFLFAQQLTITLNNEMRCCRVRGANSTPNYLVLLGRSCYALFWIAASCEDLLSLTG
jgi:hypothetical protein